MGLLDSPYRDLFQTQTSELQQSGSPIYKFCEKAYESFVGGGGFPDRKKENYKYLSLKSLRDSSFQAPSLKMSSKDLELAWIQDLRNHLDSAVVFRNGLFDSQNSFISDSIEVDWMDRSRGLACLPELIEALDTLSPDDPLDVFQKAFFNCGYSLKVKENQSIDRPIGLIHLMDAASDDLVVPVINIRVGEGSKVNLFDSVVSEEGESRGLFRSFLKLELAKNSRVEMAQNRRDRGKTFLFTKTQVKVEEDASLQLTSLAKGTNIIRNDLEVSLCGRGAAGFLNGLSRTYESETIDNHVSVVHGEGHTNSRIYFKSILDGVSKTVFNGIVKIDKQAQKVDSDQVNKNLLLSERAEVDTKPQLHVFADDVKATHGATIGQMSSQELFYLESRGLSPDQARKMLSDGFSDDIFLKMTDPNLMRLAKQEWGIGPS